MIEKAITHRKRFTIEWKLSNSKSFPLWRLCKGLPQNYVATYYTVYSHNIFILSYQTLWIIKEPQAKLRVFKIYQDILVRFLTIEAWPYSNPTINLNMSQYISRDVWQVTISQEVSDCFTDMISGLTVDFRNPIASQKSNYA